MNVIWHALQQKSCLRGVLKLQLSGRVHLIRMSINYICPNCQIHLSNWQIHLSECQKHFYKLQESLYERDFKFATLRIASSRFGIIRMFANHSTLLMFISPLFWTAMVCLNFLESIIIIIVTIIAILINITISSSTINPSSLSSIWLF